MTHKITPDVDASGPLRAVLRHRSVLLLAALLFLLLFGPFAILIRPTEQSTLARLLLFLAFMIMLLSAIVAVGRSRVVITVSLILAAPTTLLIGAATISPSDALLFPGYVMGILFLAYIIAMSLQLLFTITRVTTDTIATSLCVYLLLGVIWAMVYSLIDIIQPGSFKTPMIGEEIARQMRFGGEFSDAALYYSFVTMSTLGYGDIVPVSPIARTLSAIEGIAGQVYLAVLVARLVGLHIANAVKANGN